MELIPEYVLPPGCCGLCRGTSKPVIDTELSTEDLEATFHIPVEDRGALYICANCANEIVQMIGGLPAEAAQRLRAELDATLEELVATQDEVAAMSRVADAATEALAAREKREAITDEPKEPAHA